MAYGLSDYLPEWSTKRSVSRTFSVSTKPLNPVKFDEIAFTVASLFSL